jgi:hypothetical protein
MFVTAGTRYRRGEAAVDIEEESRSDRPGNVLRPGQRDASGLDGHRARGWSCPHCAVENFRAARDSGDVVECDYCGSAFAMPGQLGFPGR